MSSGDGLELCSGGTRAGTSRHGGSAERLRGWRCLEQRRKLQIERLEFERVVPPSKLEFVKRGTGGSVVEHGNRTEVQQPSTAERDSGAASVAAGTASQRHVVL